MMPTPKPPPLCVAFSTAGWLRNAHPTDWSSLSRSKSAVLVAASSSAMALNRSRDSSRASRT